MKTELAKLIYQEGSVTESSKIYLLQVYNELKDVGFFDHETSISINDNPKDYFWGIAVALEIISQNELGELFTNDDDDLYKIKGIKPLINNN
jgi:hypothetical protein